MNAGAARRSLNQLTTQSAPVLGRRAFSTGKLRP